MKYFIKIDRDSIHRNPKWPRSSQEPCCYVEGIVEIKEKIIDFRDNMYWLITRLDQRVEYEKHIISKFEVSKLLKNKEFSDFPIVTEIDIKRNIEPIYSMYSEPKYLFDYMPTRVQCSECNEKFYHTELESDEMNWDYYSNTVCPKCGCFDCCQLEFEDINSIIKK